MHKPMRVPPSAAAQLTAELEAGIVHELRRAWYQVNANYFRDALRAPIFALTSARDHLGRWHHERRLMEISRHLVLEHAWGTVMEVLKHEMAHQYTHEVLRAMAETAHGPAFRSICERLGIDAAASGVPTAQSASERSQEEERLIQRIARLLALAESPNAHEAQSAMNAAQKLMLKYNLQVVQSASSCAYKFRQLGKPTGRISESEHILAGILSNHFFVEAIWVPVYRAIEGKRGSVLEICGTSANLEFASYVHEFLSQTAERLWREHKAERGVRSNADRRTFVAGVMRGFQEKLRSGLIENQREGLVWIQDANLDDYFRKRHPYMRQVRYQSSHHNDAHAQGCEAGRRIVLHRPMHEAASSQGRLLPPKGAPPE